MNYYRMSGIYNRRFGSVKDSNVAETKAPPITTMSTSITNAKYFTAIA